MILLSCRLMRTHLTHGIRIIKFFHFVYKLWFPFNSGWVHRSMGMNTSALQQTAPPLQLWCTFLILLISYFSSFQKFDMSLTLLFYSKWRLCVPITLIPFLISSFHYFSLNRDDRLSKIKRGKRTHRHGKEVE